MKLNQSKMVKRMKIIKKVLQFFVRLRTYNTWYSSICVQENCNIHKYTHTYANTDSYSFVNFYIKDIRFVAKIYPFGVNVEAGSVHIQEIRTPYIDIRLYTMNADTNSVFLNQATTSIGMYKFFFLQIKKKDNL